MPRLTNPESGLVVTCGNELAARYRARGWVAADSATEPAVEAASEKPREDEPAADESVEEKPVRRSQSRRR